MRNQKGISVIKLIIIIVVIVYLIFMTINLINQKKESDKALEEIRNTANKITYYNIGDKISNYQYETKVTDIKAKTKVGTSKYSKTVDDNYYTLICVTAEIKNISSTTTKLYEYTQDFSMLFKLKDDRDKIYYNDTSYTVSYESEFDKIVNKPTLNPGDTATVVMVFKLEKFVYQQYGVYLNILDNKSLIKIN